MRLGISIVCSSILAVATAHAAEPPGDWRVQGGAAIIRIDNCGGALWGVVAWEQVPGRDANNPNPALRNRPTLGIPVLINMRPTSDGRWAGQVYNGENGQTYSANIRMLGDNALRIEGCVLGGLFCGGQQWTRVGSVAAPQAKARTTGRGGDVCSRVSNLSGRAH
jgi:uncharacterized protein (DUF2147 family)